VTVVLLTVVLVLLLLLAGGSVAYVRRRRSAEAPPAEVEAPERPRSSEQLPAPPRPAPPAPPPAAGTPPGPQVELAERPTLAARLGRARGLLDASLGAVRGRPRFDESSFEELEEALLLADVGLPLTQRLLEGLRRRIRDGAVAAEPEALLSALKSDVVRLFEGDDRELHLAAQAPSVWLLVGVNGVGKTTTLGKLAAREVASGRSVVVAAADTFRAAAGDQLAAWAERAGAGLVRGADGADPSSIVYDAVQHAAARGATLVLADTAGRLHTKTNLMEELRKVRRVASRPPGTVAEVLLVLDATTGQNGLVQARRFTEAVEVTGIVLTKLDGTAKGGIVLAVRTELGLPIKLVGLGEGVEDLVPFDPAEFAEALFS
jgi:fused signal recognition particle receptor